MNFKNIKSKVKTQLKVTKVQAAVVKPNKESNTDVLSHSLPLLCGVRV